MTRCFALISALILGLGPALPASQDPDSSPPPQWTVDAPLVDATSREISFDVKTGTWMSLDVSPDGRTIVFDLLGDIYKMPISGGSAIALTRGVSWDMQPRFSPDGTRIAFTSDRDGGDNIWTMDVTGGHLRQITKERFRLLNNPTWSPDGRYLAARKHFTTQRSLGTGEIWMYHVHGGSGVKLVARPNEQYQKELGEPMFAPGGDALYYTQNVTPGNQFIYAQDSNTELFQIKRLDLKTGDTTVAAGGPGGAVRPTPSPDGSHLAYVKRVRAKSRLFVKNLTSGEETMLVDDIDQDNQETWAVQGLYPNMDWLPDSSAIVFWAKGQIWRVSLDGKRTAIPFQVTDSRTVFPPARRKVTVAPDQFDTKIPRFAVVSPDGGSTVFESLGKLYIKIGDTAPQRLTRDNSQTFELYPVFSPDSKLVYFTTWDDADFGTIRRVAAEPTSRATIMSRQKGHYRELAINEDGSLLVYRKAEGGGVVSANWGEAPGLYVMRTQGGDERFVSPRGHNPHFVGDRLYANERINGDLTLISMTEDGLDLRQHARSALATSMTLSPKGGVVAVVQDYHLHLLPLPQSPGVVEVSSQDGALPVKRVSTLGVNYYRFSRTGTRLSWTLGPTLKSVEVASVFAEGFVAPETGTSLSMRVAAPHPTGVVALTGARIITMNDTLPVIEDGAILIRGNRIEALGSRDAVSIPSDAKRIDVSGKTIIPGLVDIHAHGPYASGDVVPQQNWSTSATLALGVTTLHDPSVRVTQFFPAAEYARAGVTLAPRMFSTGEIIYGAKAPGFYAPIETIDDALTHVRRLKAMGAIAVKNYNQPRRDQRQMVVEAARREGLFVVAEGGALYHMDMNLVVDGNTGVEHILPNDRVYDDVLSLWPQTGVGLTPTLVVGYGGLTAEHHAYQSSEVWKHPILSRYVPPSLLQARSVRRITAPEADYQDDDNAALAKALMDRGVLVSIGAHGQREGLAAHWEMWSFVRGGMSPMEALATATINPARYFGMEADIGSLEPGKLADLVVLDANPLEDIRTSDRVSMIMLDGRLYDSKTLNEVDTGDRTQRPLYWHGKAQNAIR